MQNFDKHWARLCRQEVQLKCSQVLGPKSTRAIPLNAKGWKIISQLNFFAYLSEKCSGTRIIPQVAFQAEKQREVEGLVGSWLWID